MDAWPMMERCWLAQWQGFTPEEQAYMSQEADQGRLTFIALGHYQYPIWSLERYRHGSAYPLPALPLDHLICIKVDHWPEPFEPTTFVHGPDVFRNLVELCRVPSDLH